MVLLEVYNEIKWFSEFDKFSIELQVVTTPKQKEKFYRFFEQTKELGDDIVWRHDWSEPDFKLNPEEFKKSSITLLLSWAPEFLDVPWTRPWVRIDQYENQILHFKDVESVDAQCLDENNLDMLLKKKLDYDVRSERQYYDYYCSAFSHYLERCNYCRITMGDFGFTDQQLGLLTGQHGNHENNLPDLRIDDFGTQDDLTRNDGVESVTPVQCRYLCFGLNEGSVGLPFSSRLIDMVSEYRSKEGDEKEKSRFVLGLSRLFSTKKWLGEVLSYNSLEDIDESRLDVSEPPAKKRRHDLTGKYSASCSVYDAIRAMADHPYFMAYYLDQSYLKEFLQIVGQYYQNQPVIVAPVSWEKVSSQAYIQMFEELGYSQVSFHSESGARRHCLSGDCDGRSITIVNPGPIADQDGYDALLFFSHPLVFVKGNLSLAKVIIMNKIPFYEWRTFQTTVNKDLALHHKPLSEFFENTYDPVTKAKALESVDLSGQEILEANKKMVKQFNVMPDLLEIIRLSHNPEHPLWKYHQEVEPLLEAGDHVAVVDFVTTIRDAVMQEIIALKAILYFSDQGGGAGELYHQLSLFIKDPLLRTMSFEQYVVGQKELLQKMLKIMDSMLNKNQ